MVNLVWENDCENVTKRSPTSFNMGLENYLNVNTAKGSIWIEGLEKTSPGIVAHSGSKCIGLQVTDATGNGRAELDLYPMSGPGITQNQARLIQDEFYFEFYMMLEAGWKQPLWLMFQQVTDARPTGYYPYFSVFKDPPETNTGIGFGGRRADGSALTMMAPNGMDFSIPLGEWFKVGWYMLRHESAGKIKIWFNDVLAYDLRNIQTKYVDAINPSAAYFFAPRIYYEATDPLIARTAFLDDFKLYDGDPNVPPPPPYTPLTGSRGVIVKGTTEPWANVANVVKNVGYDWMVLETCGTHFARYPSAVPGVENWSTQDDLRLFLDAAHAQGLKGSALMLFGFRPTWKAPDPDMDALEPSGNLTGWLCPNKPKSRQIIKAVVEELAHYQDLDEIMVDYFRFKWWGMCYCEYCHQKFMADTGLNVNWWTDVIDTGANFNDFLNWRGRSWTELMRDIKTWVSAINPNVRFAAAVMTAFGGNDNYPKVWYGQPTGEMLSQGLLDNLAPMMYTGNLTDLTDYINSSKSSWGKIYPFIGGMEDTNGLSPSDFAAVKAKVLELNPDGFIMYQYLNQDFFSQYNGATPPPPPPALKYICPFDNLEFATSTEAINHLNTVHYPQPPIGKWMIEFKPWPIESP